MHYIIDNINVKLKFYELKGCNVNELIQVANVNYHRSITKIVISTHPKEWPISLISNPQFWFRFIRGSLQRDKLNSLLLDFFKFRNYSPFPSTLKGQYKQCMPYLQFCLCLSLDDGNIFCKTECECNCESLNNVSLNSLCSDYSINKYTFQFKI